MKIDLNGNTKLSFFKDLYEDARANAVVRGRARKCGRVL